MNAPGGGAPRPPREIEREMEEAGRLGDQYRLDVAAARYRAWLTDQGIEEHAHGAEVPTEVFE